ncbi:MAG: MBL fold metallo-hydrolase [Clostridia bacterium]|nr:MBL fold metallo-hydrolase [Clostridia bacterium]
MILKRIKLYVKDSYMTNCYIIEDETTKETMIVDPGGEAYKVIEMVKIIGGKVKYIVLTHCHTDHISGVPEVKEELGGTVLIHRDDAEGLKNPQISLTNMLGEKPNLVIEADSRLDDGDVIHVGNLSFRIIHTPGHTKGGICLYCEQEKLLLSGDTFFRGTWGRTDLPTGSAKKIMQSIMNKILILPEDTIVYPGHRKINYDKR